MPKKELQLTLVARYLLPSPGSGQIHANKGPRKQGILLTWMAITHRVICLVISSVSFHEYGLNPLAAMGPAMIPTNNATTSKRDHIESYTRSKKENFPNGTIGKDINLQASDINSFSLTNMDTKPKMTMNPLRMATAMVNGENSPGISSTVMTENVVYSELNICYVAIMRYICIYNTGLYGITKGWFGDGKLSKRVRKQRKERKMRNRRAKIAWLNRMLMLRFLLPRWAPKKKER